MTERLSLERQLFDWNGWDEIGTGCFQFSNCTLKRDIGKFKVGDVIECVVFDIERSRLTLIPDESNEADQYHFAIAISVSEALPNLNMSNEELAT